MNDPPMSRTGLPHDVVEYPCSDGQPMAETEIHGACMMYVTCALGRRFEKRGRADVHVGMNSFLYYEQGNPRALVATDVSVVVGAPAHLRDTYLLSNEPKGPNFVLEVTSASARREDKGRKRDVYASLGMSECVLYDPRVEYLAPPMQDYRLRGSEHRLELLVMTCVAALLLHLHQPLQYVLAQLLEKISVGVPWVGSVTTTSLRRPMAASQTPPRVTPRPGALHRTNVAGATITPLPFLPLALDDNGIS